ncbi:MAG: hypothetical protein H6713_00455 [Myxococcales bacterium]|nr:hypothetical protein [Myxococcales bacterium]MCB9748452.1 hypothetical protein [Myxococcales bacterium]
MRRFALLVLLGLGLPACANKPATPSEVSVHSETLPEGDANLTLDLLYAAKGDRKVELILKMRVSGMNETEKLVGEVYIKGFNIEDGGTRWDGFVPPREPQTFRVTLRIPEGNDSASATVSLSRSHDSSVLLREELEFTVDEAGLVSGPQ